MDGFRRNSGLLHRKAKNPMIRIFTQLDSLKDSISNLLENCWYGDSFIAKEIGMSEAEFSSKKTNENWSEKELQKLI
jgi:hypothetical protein